jgi:apolipoprotein N-acyltransferase
LKYFHINRADAVRYASSATGGALLALAFPKVSIAGLAWIAPATFLLAGVGAGTRKAIRYAYFGGFVFYLAELYWLLRIPVAFLPILGWIALSGYLAIYTAAWALICRRLAGWNAFETGLPFIPALKQWTGRGAWLRRAAWSLQCAAAWVGLEIVLGRFLSGFPWDFLGVSQYRQLPIIQIAEYTGVYGVSFILIWFSVSLLNTAGSLLRDPVNRFAWSREIALPLLAVIALMYSGVHRIASQRRDAETVRMALIQPSIPQTLIWNEQENETRFRELLSLSEEALSNKVDILVWPEASVPNMVRYDQETADALVGMATRHRVWIVLGSDDAEMKPGSTSRSDILYYNSAFAISPRGELSGAYHKRQLVIFGEYVPFVKWLPFLKILSPAGESGFTPGTRAIPFELPDLGIKLSVLICFEDTFPHIVRDYVQPDTDFLVNITNNGWFGESAAQWQHAATAVFRAVENRVPLVRCANNGLTCWVDSTGWMSDVYFPESKDIYKRGFKIAEVPLLGGTRRELSFYTRHGDVFGWSCLALTVISILISFRKRHATLKALAETEPTSA